jgi:hypothetical protein
MKKRHSVDNNIKKFYKMVKQGQVVFDSPIQRDEKMWNNLQKSKLIRAILIDFSIPPVYSVGSANEDGELIYSILDGKQRLTTLIEFLDNEWSVGNIQEIEYEGQIYNIKGKRFETLPVELQEAIYDYSLSMTYYTSLTDDEIIEMFDLLNNGTPLSRQQKANAYMGMEAASKMLELKRHPFITINASLGRNVHLKALDAEVLVQAMMIIDDEYALHSFSGKNMDEYSASLKNKEYILDEMMEVLDYVHTALDFYTDKLVMKKTIIPIVLYIGSIAKEVNMDKDMFFKWVQEFKLSIENRGKIKINYAEYMGTGSFSKNKVFGRINAATRHYKLFTNAYLEMEKENEATPGMLENQII